MTTQRAGFTLPETLIVVLILGILAGIALPRYWESVNNYRADLAQQQLVSDLKLASTLARSQCANQRIVFSTKDQIEGSYYYLDGYADPEHNYTDKETRLDEAPYLVTLDSSPAEIIFDMYGLPNSSCAWIINQGTPYERTVEIDYPNGGINTP